MTVVRSHATTPGGLEVSADEGTLTFGDLYFIGAEAYLAVSSFSCIPLGAATVTWESLEGIPPFAAVGDTAEAARAAIGAGTSDLKLGPDATDAKPGNWLPLYSDIQDLPNIVAAGDTEEEVRDLLGLGSAALAEADSFATAAQGVKADRVLRVLRVTNHTVAQYGVHYELAAPGLTLTMPASANTRDSESIGFTNTSSGEVFINWQGVKVKGVVPDTPFPVRRFGKAIVTYCTPGSTWI